MGVLESDHVEAGCGAEILGEDDQVAGVNVDPGGARDQDSFDAQVTGGGTDRSRHVEVSIMQQIVELYSERRQVAAVEHGSEGNRQLGNSDGGQPG